MTLPELNALVDELDVCVRHYSSCLVRELAMRDELEYEQDVKDLFFTRLHEVQTRMAEWTVRYADQNLDDGVDFEVNEDSGHEKARGIFSGASSTSAAKELLANAALAVRRRWRRMGQSLEKARSTWHRHRSRRNRRITVDESLDGGDLYRGRTQPINLEKMCVSNSNVELASSDGEAECGLARMTDEEGDEEWSVRSDTNSAATTPTTGGGIPASDSAASAYHSPRRNQIWFTSATAGAIKAKSNPEEDLKVGFLVPIHGLTEFYIEFEFWVMVERTDSMNPINLMQDCRISRKKRKRGSGRNLPF